MVQPLFVEYKLTKIKFLSYTYRDTPVPVCRGSTNSTTYRGLSDYHPGSSDLKKGFMNV